MFRGVNSFLASFSRLSGIFKIKGPRHIYVYSVFIGIFSGLIAVAFSGALSTVEHLNFHVLAGMEERHPPPPGEVKSILSHVWEDMLPTFSSPYFLFFLPVLGGLLVGLILQFVYREASGAGTDSMVRAFHQREGKIPGRGALFKGLATILTLSTGGSGGREGPTAYIGAALGSRLGRILGAGARARRTLLLAGTAGGLGAIFRAPLGGAMTAVEIIYREDIESDSLVPCLISSVTAYLTFTSIVGPGSLFEVSGVGLKDYREIFIYLVLGLVCYGVGFIYVSLIRLIERLMQSLRIPLLCKPALGGLGIGCLAISLPEVIGTGMGFLHETINGRGSVYDGAQGSSGGLSLAGFFLLLALFKIIATAMSIGSGGSGGLFAPSLFIGAMLGGSVANFSQWLLPHWELHNPSFMLVGMGAFFAGVARTPFSAMIMISDIIGSYALLPPLMIVSMITFVLSSRWSLYKGQVHNRFKSPAHFWDMRLDILEKLKVSQEFPKLQKTAMITSGALLNDVEKLSLKIQASDFVVTQSKWKKEYYAMFSLKKISLKDHRQNKKKPKKIGELSRAYRKFPTVRKDTSLAEALQKITENEMDKIAVVDPKNKVLGYVLYNEILRAYRRHITSP